MDEGNKIKIEDLREAFGEGVFRTAEEGWVAPEQIEDEGWRARYAEIVELWMKLDKLVGAMENDLDELPESDAETQRTSRQAEVAEAERDQHETEGEYQARQHWGAHL
jgi:hypothetical protein